MIENKLIKEVAEEMGLSVDIVRLLVNDQKHFIKDTMEQGDFRGVKIDYVGKFVVKPTRLEFLRHMSVQKKLKQKYADYKVFMDFTLLHGFKTTIPDWILASTKLEQIKGEWDNLLLMIETLTERPTFEEAYGRTEREFYKLKQDFFRNLNKKMND